MADNLIELTDRVLKDVIKNQVILPSPYKEHFETHARDMNIDLNYEAMMESIAQKEFNTASELMNKTSCNIDDLQETTEHARLAIQSQDLQQLAQVINEINSLKSSLGDLKAQLHTDTLTKAHNRKWLIENLLLDGKFLNEGILAFIDLDNFKKINDNHGHVIGDKVLQYIASFLNANLKDMEVVRYAGDEFLVVSKKLKMEDCYTQLKKLQEDLLNKKLKASNGELLYIAFSYGLTRFEKGADFRDILEIADSLMYENKRNKVKK